MDRIARYIGLKRSQSKRMELSRARCGKAHLVILVTGAITVRKGSVSSSTLKATNTRACGPWTRSMARVRIGVMKEVNSDVNTQVIGLKTKSMEEAHSSLRIAIGMMAIGSTVCHKEKEE